MKRGRQLKQEGLFQSFGRIIMYIQINPQRTGEAEDPDKENGEDKDQECEGRPCTPFEYPVKKEDEAKTKESGKDVGEEHRTIIKSGFGHIVFVAMCAAIGHVKGFLKRPSTCSK